MKILVRGTNWIGDSVMSVPALRKLRQSIPGARITLASPAWSEGIFRDADFLDDILVIKATGHSLGAVRARTAEYREGGFDAAILFTNSFVSALTVRTAGIRQRFGYGAEGRRFLLSKSFPKPDWKNERHESEYYLSLVENSIRELGSVPADGTPDSVIPVSESRRHNARSMLEAKGVGSSERFAVIGAGSTNSRAKRWPAERFATVADALKKDRGLKVVLLGSDQEREIAEEVASAASSELIDLTGETTLDEAIGILSEASLMISNDMGLAHIASAVGAPTITIFGPTNHLTTAPLGSEIIREDVECSPCMLRDCPIDHRCMTRISPEQVVSRAAELLG